MLIKMFERMTEEQPTVVYIRDLQWATEATRQLLGLIIERSYNRPLLFILSERSSSSESQAAPFVREETQLSVISLEPLKDAECTELVRHCLRKLVEVPNDLERQIVALSGGNPLVVMETIQDLIDESALDLSGEHWKLTSRGKIRLPDSVESLFTNRLKHLPRPQKRALEVASVAQAILTPELLNYVLGEDLNINDLDELIERGWLCENRTEGSSLRFVQNGAAETIYRSLPASRRRELHEAVTLFILGLSDSAQSRISGRLAHHLHASGHYRKAVLHAENAAIRASRLLAFQEALEYFSLALECLEKSRDEKASNHNAIALRIGHQLLHQQILAGRLETAVETSKKLETYTSGALNEESQEHLARIQAAQGRALEQLGRFKEAQASFESSEKTVQKLKEAPLTRLWVATGRAGAKLKLGESEKATEILEDAIEQINPRYMQDRSSKEALCRAYRVLGNTKLRLQNFEEARTRYDQAKNLATVEGLPSEIVDALNGLAACHYFQNALGDATQTWRQALEVAEKWDLVQHRAVLLGNLGELAISSGEMGKAAELLIRAEALHEHLRSDEGIAECAHLLGKCLRENDQWLEAENAYRRSLEAATRSTSAKHQAQAQLGLAEVLEMRWPKEMRSKEQLTEIIHNYTLSAESFEASRDADSAQKIRAHVSDQLSRS